MTRWGMAMRPLNGCASRLTSQTFSADSCTVKITRSTVTWIPMGVPSTFRCSRVLDARDLGTRHPPRLNQSKNSGKSGSERGKAHGWSHERRLLHVLAETERRSDRDAQAVAAAVEESFEESGVDPVEGRLHANVLGSVDLEAASGPVKE